MKKELEQALQNIKLGCSLAKLTVAEHNEIGVSLNLVHAECERKAEKKRGKVKK